MANAPKGKPVLDVMIGVPSGKGAPPDAKDAGKGKSGGKFPPKKGKASTKPGPGDKQNAIAKRLAALNGGISSTNNDAGNASGGLPGM